MSLPPQRLRQQQLIRECCETSPKWADIPAETQDSIVRKIERDCFGRTIETCKKDGIDRLFTEKKFCERYSLECYRIASNLDVGVVLHDYLLDKICKGDVNPDYITSLSNSELCPPANQAERDEIERRRAVVLERKISYMYTCSKCKKNETTYYKYQARSADEDETQSIKCIRCGHTWRI